jgi:hypothetical protein
MADTKISALPASTTPLAGTEVLPIVQSAATKQVSVANLTAGRAVSAASVTASTGNFVVGTAGQGIDFSANTAAPGMTSELLTWYEEGTFTPTIGGATTAGVQTYVVQTGFYTRIGNRVYFNLRIVLSAKDAATSGSLIIAGLPFTSNTTASNFSPVSVSVAGLITLTVLYTQVSSQVENNSAFMYLGQIGSGQSFSYLQAAAFTDTTRIAISGNYAV